MSKLSTAAQQARKSKKETNKGIRKHRAGTTGNWLGQWVDMVYPSVVNYFLEQANRDTHREYKGKDRIPVNFGIDVEVEMNNGRFVINNWYVFSDEKDFAKALAAGDGIVTRRFMTFSALQQMAQNQHNHNIPMEMGYIAIPEIVIADSVPGARDWLDELPALIHPVAARISGIYEDRKAELVGKIKAGVNEKGDVISNDKKHTAANLVYDRNKDEVLFVTQTQGLLDVVKGVAIDQNMDAIEIEGGLPFHERDVNKINSQAELASQIAARGGWEQLARPSKEAYEEASVEVVGILLERADIVIEKAKEVAKEKDVEGEGFVAYDPMTSRLDVFYPEQFAANEEHPDVEIDGSLKIGRNIGVLLEVISRIEDVIWLGAKASFEKAFFEKYGDNTAEAAALRKAGEVRKKEKEAKLARLAEEAKAEEEAALAEAMHGDKADLELNERGLTKATTPIDDAVEVEVEDSEAAGDENFALKA